MAGDGRATAQAVSVSDLEAAFFRAINDLPDGLLPIIWLPMQSGSFAAVPIAGAAALAFIDRRSAVTIATAGLTAYLLAKGVKRLHPRPRPADLLPDVHVRGAPQAGSGLPSGHAAVAAALASAALSELPAGWRVSAVSLAVAAPFGRVYVGAHLPLDVVAGSVLGLAVAAIARRLMNVGGRGSR